MSKVTMEKIVSLCKRRGFIFPGSEIYGGLANSWDYGPVGVELKNNIRNLWWEKFVTSRDDIVGIDAAIMMNNDVWKNSGHLDEFSDPLVECKKCHKRFRLEDIGIECPGCKGELTQARQFNMMFKTHLGPVADDDSQVFFRPEIAQAMFVDFKNVLDTTRKRLPFGIASIGKAFRNEITPGNFTFRTREFDLMELEYFVYEKEWKKWFEYWQKQMKDWLKELGVNMKNVVEVDVAKDDRAHYSKKTVDFEYKYPFGQKELYGLAYRTDYDLKKHYDKPPYRDPNPPAGGNESFYPHVIEPSFGLDRTMLAVLLDAYHEEAASAKASASQGRTVLKLPAHIAPYKAAVFPLLHNKPELVKFAREVYDDLLKDFAVTWDARGNIGKRYFSQDEIGTPYCITVDFDSLENQDVTIRDRDTMKQERIKILKLGEYLAAKIK